MRIVIAGGGVAAAEAAAAIRQYDQTSSIELYTNENVLPYRRTMLPKMLAGKFDRRRLEIYPADFYLQNNIKLVFSETVRGIDRINKYITLQSKKQIFYDRLLLATGKKSRTFFIDPCLQNKVFTLHDLTDMEKISNALADARSAVVIGGGVLGLEIASALLQKSLKVHIIEQHDHLLHNILDDECASFLRGLLGRVEGLTIHTSSIIREIFPHQNQAALLLNDQKNTLIEADMIIPAIGLENKEQFGFELKTDQYMQIENCKNIFAAGDCATVCGRVNRYYQSARMQGIVAGKNIAGQRTEYLFRPEECRCIFQEIPIYSAGCTAESQCESAVERKAKSIKKLFYKENKLVGCILAGDCDNSGELYRLIRENYCLDN